MELAQASTQQIYAELLRRIGEDPARDGLLRTPERMEKSMQFLTRGYKQNVNEVLHGALFDVDYDEMVIVKGIEMFSLCEHHMLPFFGKVHVAYIPKKKVIGLSKIPRLVEVFARRLQVQERLTRQIADAIQDVTRRDDLVLDLFLGSGTTLLAAEQTWHLAESHDWPAFPFCVGSV